MGHSSYGGGASRPFADVAWMAAVGGDPGSNWVVASSGSAVAGVESKATTARGRRFGAFGADFCSCAHARAGLVFGELGALTRPRQKPHNQQTKAIIGQRRLASFAQYD